MYICTKLLLIKILLFHFRLFLNYFFIRENKYVKPEIIILNISDGDSLLYNIWSSEEGNPEEIDSKSNDSFVDSQKDLWDEPEDE